MIHTQPDNYHSALSEKKREKRRRKHTKHKTLRLDRMMLDDILKHSYPDICSSNIPLLSRTAGDILQLLQISPARTPHCLDLSSLHIISRTKVSNVNPSLFPVICFDFIFSLYFFFLSFFSSFFFFSLLSGRVFHSIIRGPLPPIFQFLYSALST